jgi:transcriptional regulator of acetoin/glycerol metabolism
MSDMPVMVARVQQARELFFAEGRSPDGWVPPHITRSWMRCRSNGHRPDLWAPMATALVQARRHDTCGLLACAQPELDGLADHVAGTGCIAVICDAAGVILDEVGCPDFVPKADRVALRLGADWSESARGTNAIGTVLIEREPLAVLGGEHFLDDNAILACAAAPIFDGQGAIAGVLDMSGEPARLDTHALGIVRLAARQIEHRLLLATARGQLLRFHIKPTMLGTPREGLIAVEDGQVIAANGIGLALLGETWETLLGQPVERLIGRPWSRVHPHGALITLPGGTSLVATIIPASTRVSVPVGELAHLAPHAIVADPFDALVAQAIRVLDAGVPVLISGETGVGKEVFAQRLHREGRRRAGPFVAVNCAALPETLIESELFGYDDGAFTGARRRGAPGRLREAHGGVLFLDEIGDMPLAMQTRLLRVLETREVLPLGGGKPVAVDFDLVCASHCDLPRLAAEGGFRSDLLYRIAGYGVALPPLRERPDRRALIQRLFDGLAQVRRLRLSCSALDALDRHPWPGNVRELLNVLKTVVALATDGECITHVPLAHPDRVAPCVADVAPVPLGDLMEQAIARTLAACDGRVAETARRLGVHRSTVYRHLAATRTGSG